MKLSRVTSSDPLERLTASVRKSTSEMLAAYQKRYCQVYGDEIDKSKLVDELLRGFMLSDKDFVKFLDEQRSQSSAGAGLPGSASPTAPAA